MNCQVKERENTKDDFRNYIDHNCRCCAGDQHCGGAGAEEDYCCSAEADRAAARGKQYGNQEREKSVAAACENKE